MDPPPPSPSNVNTAKPAALSRLPPSMLINHSSIPTFTLIKVRISELPRKHMLQPTRAPSSLFLLFIFNLQVSFVAPEASGQEIEIAHMHALPLLPS